MHSAAACSSEEKVKMLCFRGLGRMPPHAFTAKSPTGKATAETSWQDHFASRSSCKLEAINFRCKQVILLILVPDSSGSHKVPHCVPTCEGKKVLCQMLLSISPSGHRIPKGRSVVGWRLATNKWSCCFVPFDRRKVYEPDNLSKL